MSEPTPAGGKTQQSLMSRLRKAMEGSFLADGARATRRAHDALWRSLFLGHPYTGDACMEMDLDLPPSEVAALYELATETVEAGEGNQGRLLKLDYGEGLSVIGQTRAFWEIIQRPESQRLFRIMGRPGEFVVGPAQRDAAAKDGEAEIVTCGKYNISSDVLHLGVTDSARGIARLLSTFRHEMAHVWQSRQGDLIGRIWNQHDVRPPGKDNKTYAIRSRIEHQAEAIAAAIGYLNFLERRDLPPMNAEAAGNVLEAKAPGTRLMARILLSHPEYQAHPAHRGPIGQSGAEMKPIMPDGGWPAEIPTTTELRNIMFIAAEAGGVLGRTVSLPLAAAKRRVATRQALAKADPERKTGTGRMATWPTR